jgi:hypothetical protein
MLLRRRPTFQAGIVLDAMASFTGNQQIRSPCIREQ